MWPVKVNQSVKDMSLVGVNFKYKRLWMMLSGIICLHLFEIFTWPLWLVFHPVIEISLKVSEPLLHYTNSVKRFTVWMELLCATSCKFMSLHPHFKSPQGGIQQIQLRLLYRLEYVTMYTNICLCVWERRRTGGHQMRTACFHLPGAWSLIPLSLSD